MEFTCMLMEDGLVHRVVVRVDSHHYRIACSNLLFDLDENGSVVLEPLTCLECVVHDDWRDRRLDELSKLTEEAGG